MQLSIIRSLEKKLGEEAMKHRFGFTPGTPRFIRMRVADGKNKLPAQEQATYRSGPGTLLYLTFIVSNQTQQTRSLQCSKRTVKNNG